MPSSLTAIRSTDKASASRNLDTAAEELAHLLDKQGAGYPRITILDQNGEILGWEYSRHYFAVFEGSRPIKLPIALAERGFTRVEVASMTDALRLVSRVESLRQGTSSPYIHIASTNAMISDR